MLGLKDVAGLTVSSVSIYDAQSKSTVSWKLYRGKETQETRDLRTHTVTAGYTHKHTYFYPSQAETPKNLNKWRDSHGKALLLQLSG